MGSVDKAKNAGQRAKGKVETVTGRATGNARLRGKGAADQLKARARQTAERVKDALRP